MPFRVFEVRGIVGMQKVSWDVGSVMYRVWNSSYWSMTSARVCAKKGRPRRRSNGASSRIWADACIENSPMEISRLGMIRELWESVGLAVWMVVGLLTVAGEPSRFQICREIAINVLPESSTPLH